MRVGATGGAVERDFIGGTTMNGEQKTSYGVLFF